MPTNPIFKKLQLKPNTTLCVLGAPPTYRSVLESAPKDVQVSTTLRGKFDAIHLFATDLKGVLANAPKLKAAKGLEAVRQIAIDDTWSALRFKVTG